MQSQILMEPDAVAALFRVSKQTLRRWWQAGLFPAPLRCGRRSIRWRLSDIQTFIEKKGKEDATFARPTEAGNRTALPR